MLWGAAGWTNYLKNTEVANRGAAELAALQASLTTFICPPLFAESIRTLRFTQPSLLCPGWPPPHAKQVAGCSASSLSFGGWSQAVPAVQTMTPAVIHNSFRALVAVGPDRSTRASKVLPAPPFPFLCRSTGRAWYLTWSSPGPHSTHSVQSNFP